MKGFHHPPKDQQYRETGKKCVPVVDMNWTDVYFLSLFLLYEKVTLNINKFHLKGQSIEIFTPSLVNHLKWCDH